MRSMSPLRRGPGSDLAWILLLLPLTVTAAAAAVAALSDTSLWSVAHPSCQQIEWIAFNAITEQLSTGNNGTIAALMPAALPPANLTSPLCATATGSSSSLLSEFLNVADESAQVWYSAEWDESSGDMYWLVARSMAGGAAATPAIGRFALSAPPAQLAIFQPSPGDVSILVLLADRTGLFHWKSISALSPASWIASSAGLELPVRSPVPAALQMATVAVGAACVNAAHASLYWIGATSLGDPHLYAANLVSGTQQVSDWTLPDVDDEVVGLQFAESMQALFFLQPTQVSVLYVASDLTAAAGGSLTTSVLAVVWAAGGGWRQPAVFPSLLPQDSDVSANAARWSESSQMLLLVLKDAASGAPVLLALKVEAVLNPADIVATSLFLQPMPTTDMPAALLLLFTSKASVLPPGFDCRLAANANDPRCLTFTFSAIAQPAYALSTVTVVMTRLHETPSSAACTITFGGVSTSPLSVTFAAGFTAAQSFSFKMPPVGVSPVVSFTIATMDPTAFVTPVAVSFPHSLLPDLTVPTQMQFNGSTLTDSVVDPCVTSSPCLYDSTCSYEPSTNSFGCGCQPGFGGPACSFAVLLRVGYVTCLDCSNHSIELWGVGLSDVAAINVSEIAVAFTVDTQPWTPELRAQWLPTLRPAVVERLAFTAPFFNGTLLASIVRQASRTLLSLPSPTGVTLTSGEKDVDFVLSRQEGASKLRYRKLVTYLDSNCVHPGEFKSDGRGGCTPCPEGGLCPGDGTVWPVVGYWSVNQYSNPIRCLDDVRCPGASPGTISANGGTTQVCAEGYGGQACSECQSHFYAAGSKCWSCGSDSASQAYFVTITLVAAGVLLLLSLAVSVLHAIWLARVVTVFVLVQNGVAIGQAALQNFSGSQWQHLSELFTIASVINWDIKLLRMGCSVVPQVPFLQLFWLTMLYFFITCGAFWIACSIRKRVDLARIKKRDTPAEQRTAKRAVLAANRRRLVHAMLIFGTLIYFKVCELLLQGVHCVQQYVPADGFQSDSDAHRYFLRVDSQTECFTNLHLGTMFFIGMMFLVFVAGFPVLCLILLSRTFGSEETSGCTGALIRRCRILRPQVPEAANKKVNPAVPAPHSVRGTSRVGWEAKVDVDTAKAHLLATETALVATEQFGFLFNSLSLDHFAFRLSYFVISFCTALIGEFVGLRQSDLKLFLMGVVFAAKCLSLCLYLPFRTFRGNAKTAAVYLTQLTYCLAVLAVQSIKPGTSTRTLVVLFAGLYVCVCLLSLLRKQLTCLYSGFAPRETLGDEMDDDSDNDTIFAELEQRHQKQRSKIQQPNQVVAMVTLHVSAGGHAPAHHSPSHSTPHAVALPSLHAPVSSLFSPPGPLESAIDDLELHEEDVESDEGEEAQSKRTQQQEEAKAIAKLRVAAAAVVAVRIRTYVDPPRAEMDYLRDLYARLADQKLDLQMNVDPLASDAVTLARLQQGKTASTQRILALAFADATLLEAFRVNEADRRQQTMQMSMARVSGDSSPAFAAPAPSLSQSLSPGAVVRVHAKPTRLIDVSDDVETINPASPSAVASNR